MTLPELEEELIPDEPVWGPSVLEAIQPQMERLLEASRIPSELLNIGLSGSIQHLEALPSPPLIPMQSFLDQAIVRNDDRTIHVEYADGEWNVDLKPNYRERIDEDVDWYGFSAKTMHICKESKHPKTLCGREVKDTIKTHMDPDSPLVNSCKTCHRIEYSPPAGFYKERKL